MVSASWTDRRSELRDYFDRTAVEAWTKLTSEAPVGRIRATVRAGRNAMRDTLLSWLPQDLRGVRILDAGCGTGALSIEAARRGADVLAIDISPTLIDLAQERSRQMTGCGQVTFAVGDMLDPALGTFDFVVAMDSLIHYDGGDIASTLETLAMRTRRAILLTVAPKTPALMLMHAVGRAFPRADRAPSIEPISLRKLEKIALQRPGLGSWTFARTHQVHTGFYISKAVEVRRS
jgi:magnesium-protoporphyrin O-methyltransferase